VVKLFAWDYTSVLEHWRNIFSFVTETERPAHRCTGRPVDCLGLTKRWSLYVASYGNSGSCNRTSGATDAGIQSTHRLVCGL